MTGMKEHPVVALINFVYLIFDLSGKESFGILFTVFLKRETVLYLTINDCDHDPIFFNQH